MKRLLLVIAPAALAWYIGHLAGLGSQAICTASSPRIYTVDAETPLAECLVFRGSDLIYVGGRPGVPRLASVRILPAPQTVIPGLIDAHAHLLEAGEAENQVDLRGATSAAQTVSRVIEWVETHAPALDELVLGLGWDQGLWDPAEFPTAAMLDVPKLKGRRIFLKRVDFHAAWVSPTLLAMLEPSLPSHIDGGEIVRDKSGKPQGIFLDAALDFVYERLPRWTDAQRLRFLEIAAADLLAMGIVGVHDAAVSRETAAFYRRLDQDRQLPLSVFAMLDCLNNSFCGDSVERYHGDRFELRAVKLFADGALGSFGAAMLEPYSDKPESSGIMRSPAESFAPLVARWSEAGWQVTAHAIGDLANQVIVDAFASVLGGGATNKRFRVEHAQIVRPQEREKMARFGIIASMQPTHATSDMRYAESRLGSRAEYAYSWQSMVDAHIPLCLSSDAPVESFSPFRGMYAAITRLDPDSHSSPHGPGGWFPAERLSRTQALRGFTIGAAYASFSEQRTGSITKGKLADLLIIDRDIMRIEPPEQILETSVLSTIFRGREVFTK